MSIFRALSTALSRRAASRRVEEVATASAAPHRESVDVLAAAAPLSTQGVRPYGRGY